MLVINKFQAEKKSLFKYILLGTLLSSGISHQEVFFAQTKKTESQLASKPVTKQVDQALTATVILLQRQICLDFMNDLTKTTNYKFNWQDPKVPLIGMFEDSKTKIAGCGQIGLPVDPKAKQPQQNYLQFIANAANGNSVLQILSKNLTKDFVTKSNTKADLKQLDLKPFAEACTLYQDKIINNSAISNKLITSFGLYQPDFPLISIDQNKIKKYVNDLNILINLVVAKGCDGKGSGSGNGDNGGGDQDKSGPSSGTDGAGAGLGGGSGFGSDDFSGLAPWNPSTQIDSDDAGGGGSIDTGVGSGGGGSSGSDFPSNNNTPDPDPGPIPGPPGPGACAGYDCSICPGPGCCDASKDPTCKKCAPDDPSCTPCAGKPCSDCPGTGCCKPSDPGCPSGGQNPDCPVKDFNNNGICPIFDGNSVIPNNIKRYTEQTGFIYNLPNPGGEKDARNNTVVPCYSASGCQDIYNYWQQYSNSRKTLFNQPLDTYQNNPDQLWFYHNDDAEYNQENYWDNQKQRLEQHGPWDN